MLAAATVAIGVLLTMVSAAVAGPGAAPCPWTNPDQSIAKRVAEVISQITVPEEITMVEGHGTTNPYVFYMAGIPRLCIPAMGLEDGPSGMADKLNGVTQLPAGVALAATWDPSLANGSAR